ncbi:MAG: YidC/Oxa1 family membrane protein insertase [Solirubrobacterales bacterium]
MMLAVFGPIQPLVNVADTIITWLHDDVGFGWGMAIVGLTVIVRLAILPLTLKQVKSMNAMRALQPQMKEIQQKYKDDTQRRNQEMMKFYRTNNVNPLSSCLPLLLQLPVFFALFELLRSAEFKAQIEASAEQGWLFVPNLAEKATGTELVVLLVLYVGSQLASSIVMAIATDGTQRFLMFGLPFIFVPFIISFPAGLIVYWITTNFWTFGQQIVVRRIAPPVPVAAGAAALVDSGPEKAPPPPPKKKKRRRR